MLFWWGWSEIINEQPNDWSFKYGQSVMALQWFAWCLLWGYPYSYHDCLEDRVNFWLLLHFYKWKLWDQIVGLVSSFFIELQLNFTENFYKYLGKRNPNDKAPTNKDHESCRQLHWLSGWFNATQLRTHLMPLRWFTLRKIRLIKK